MFVYYVNERVGRVIIISLSINLSKCVRRAKGVFSLKANKYEIVHKSCQNWNPNPEYRVTKAIVSHIYVFQILRLSVFLTDSLFISLSWVFICIWEWPRFTWLYVVCSLSLILPEKSGHKHIVKTLALTPQVFWIIKE